jgi:hypothetical protein
VSGALGDLRRIARGIHPPVLDSGLADALASLAATSPIPARVRADLPERPSAAIETMAYFCVAELLANAIKHSSALPGDFAGGAGGGASTLFAQPVYQRGIVPRALSHSGGASVAVRVLPDIAADADPSTGMLIGFTTPLTPGGVPHYLEGVGGGTSLATPLIAGIQADAQQAQNGVPIGFANPAIYARYGTSAYHDVTDHPLGGRFVIAAVDAERNPVTGTITNLVDTFAQDSSLHATPGYDDVTGVGTPTSGYLDSYRARRRAPGPARSADPASLARLVHRAG